MSNDDTSQKKTIKINPSFFNLDNNSKKKGKNKKTLKSRNKIKPKKLRPNKIKKELIKKIKDHQKKSREKNDENIESNTIKNENETSFEDDFKKSLTYLDSLVKKKQMERKNNKSLKRKNANSNSNTNIHIPTNGINEIKNNNTQSNINKSIKDKYLQNTIISDKSAIISNPKTDPNTDINNSKNNSIVYTPITDIINVFDDVSDKVGTTPLTSFYTTNEKKERIEIKKDKERKGTEEVIERKEIKEMKGKNKLSKENTSINLNNTNNNNTIQVKKDPPYGCLKGGNKPTYSQYNKTLKKPQIQLINTQNVEKLQVSNTENISATSAVNNINSIIQERKEKMEKLKQKIQLSNNQYSTNGNNANGDGNNNMNENTNNKNKHKSKPSLRERYRKYKLRTIKKTFKLGKYKDKKSIGILIKNQQTRKKIQHDISLIKKTPLIQIKRYLKEKGLLKVGSSAPEYILREIYKETMLSGDIVNKNGDVLVHNYMNDDK